jgi:hypothetical protein
MDCKAHHLPKEAKREKSGNFEDIETTTAEVWVYEGLEGGFVSFDQHALMLSTIERLAKNNESGKVWLTSI